MSLMRSEGGITRTIVLLLRQFFNYCCLCYVSFCFGLYYVLFCMGFLQLELRIFIDCNKTYFDVYGLFPYCVDY